MTATSHWLDLMAAPHTSCASFAGHCRRAATSPEGTQINLTSTVTDPDSTVFTYQWTVTKNGVAFGTTGSSSSYSFTPDDNATFVVTLSVSDGIDSGTTSKTINVKNVAPTLTVSGASTTNEGATYTLTLGSSDPALTRLLPGQLTGVMERLIR